MRAFFERVLTYRVVSGVSAASAFLVAAGWAWACVALRDTSPYIIAHWNSDLDITQAVIGQDIPAFLAGIGGTGLFFVLVNWLLALELERRDRFWGKLVAGATAAVAALIFIGFAAIIAVN